MDAYDYCRHLVDTYPDRWTGSCGERESGDWMECQLARMGYDTRQTRFDCPGWEYEGEEVYLAGEQIDAGAQFYSVGCDVEAPLALITPDGQGGFEGRAAGKIALVKEADTGEVDERNSILSALEQAGAVALIIESVYPDTYSTKMVRTPECTLPAVGVSTATGEQLRAAAGGDVRLAIRAKQTQSTTSNVFGEKGPADGPVFVVSAHHEASPASPGAYDNASGVGIVLEMAERCANTELRARLRFAGWGGHEFGVFGSKQYVQNYREEADRIKRLLVFDGAGVADAAPGVTAWGSDELKKETQAFAEGRPGMRFRAGSGSGGGDASAFVPVGIDSLWLGVYDWSKAAPFHSPIDDMRWISREAMAMYVDLGMALVGEWTSAC